MQSFRINENTEAICEASKTRNGFKHTATLLINGHEVESVKINYVNRIWERYTFESVLKKLLEASSLPEVERIQFEEVIKNGGEREMANLKTVGMEAAMGEMFGKTQKEKNDWKERMLKAGLGDKGLMMPDGWENLSEEEKEERLNMAISQLLP